MTTKGQAASKLLSCGDADFDSTITSMTAKDLMGLISSLQREMAKEQENFNGLSGALQGLKDSKSRQYKTISRDMVASQGRLTTLMNRSMKCFSQQNLPHNINSNSSQGSQLQRRNSAKVDSSSKSSISSSNSSSSSSSSPAKSVSVQRSRSLHATVQPSSNTSDNDNKTTPATRTTPSSQSQQPPSSSSGTSPPTHTPVVYRGGGGGGVSRGGVSRALSSRAEFRPASVVGVNGVGVGARTTPVVASGGGSRVSGGGGGVASSLSLSSLNVQPQPQVTGLSSAGLNDNSHQQSKGRSRSQILMTPSPAFSQPLRAFASHPLNNNTASPLLTHAYSQPSLAASSFSSSSSPPNSSSSSSSRRPAPHGLADSQPSLVSASSPSPTPSPTSQGVLHVADSQPEEKGANNNNNSNNTANNTSSVLPSVRQLAQTFGARSAGSGGQSNPATTNYRPVIRAQSMAAADRSSPRQPLLMSSDSFKVNGVPAMTSVGGGRGGGRVQGQYVKRAAAPKPPNNNNNANNNTTAITSNGQSELEKVQARLRASRDVVNLSALPDKPKTPMSSNNNGSSSSREVSYHKTNLDRMKSSSSILLGQKTEFDDDENTLSGEPSSPQSPGLPQLSPMRRAQSREELYAIESRARSQKDALLQEIGHRKKDAGEKTAASKAVVAVVPESPPLPRQWGLKGNSILAQRLQQGEFDFDDRFVCVLFVYSLPVVCVCLFVCVFLCDDCVCLPICICFLVFNSLWIHFY